ncbi:MAG: glyoxalase, partial [Sphingomonadales bacterium 32-64-22]
MFSHLSVGSNDIARSKAFYDALFTACGGNPAFVDPKGRLVYVHKDAKFLVTRPIDGEPA